MIQHVSFFEEVLEFVDFVLSKAYGASNKICFFTLEDIED